MALLEDILKRVVAYTSIVGGVSSTIYTNFPKAIAWREIQRTIDVHYKGIIYSGITVLRPNEGESSKDYREKSYQGITTPFFRKALTQVKRILLSSSIDINATEETIKYINEPNFDELSLYDFFCTNLAEKVIGEPNGLTAIYPPQYISEKNTNQIQFIQSKYIIQIDKEGVTFLSILDSKYTESYSTNTCQNGKTEKTITFTEIVYHTFTKQGLIVWKNQGNNIATLVYEYQMNDIPCFQNGGVKYDDEYVYYSVFSHAIPFGECAINAHSDTQIVNANFAYPYVSMQAEDCHICNGSGEVKSEIISVFGNTYERKSCASCKGTGKKVLVGPGKVFLRPKRTSNVEPEGENRDLVEFYAPPTEILDYSNKVWKDYLVMFKEALCLYEPQDFGKNTSGYSVEAQLQPLLDMMQAIGLIIFNNFEKSLKAIQAYNEPNAPAPSVNRPISYHLQSESDALKALSEVLQKDMTPILRREMIKSYISKYLGQKSPVNNYISILELADKYFYYSDLQKSELLANGGIGAEEYRISCTALGTLISLVQNGELENLSNQESANLIISRINGLSK